MWLLERDGRLVVDEAPTGTRISVIDGDSVPSRASRTTAWTTSARLAWRRAARVTSNHRGRVLEPRPQRLGHDWATPSHCPVRAEQQESRR